jgi:hypothetical protein
VRRATFAAGIATLAATSTAAAEPIGALVGGSELAIVGAKPRQRVNAAAILYVTPRLGLHASLARLALDGDSGAITAGIAYRANAARPRLELVVHAGVGYAWPAAPVAAVGVTTFLWPTRLPLALAAGVRAYAFGQLEPSPIALSLDLGLALAH